MPGLCAPALAAVSLPTLVAVEGAVYNGLCNGFCSAGDRGFVLFLHHNRNRQTAYKKQKRKEVYCFLDLIVNKSFLVKEKRGVASGSMVRFPNYRLAFALGFPPSTPGGHPTWRRPSGQGASPRQRRLFARGSPADSCCSSGWSRKAGLN